MKLSRHHPFLNSLLGFFFINYDPTNRFNSCIPRVRSFSFKKRSIRYENDDEKTKNGNSFKKTVISKESFLNTIVFKNNRFKKFSRFINDDPSLTIVFKKTIVKNGRLSFKKKKIVFKNNHCSFSKSS